MNRVTKFARILNLRILDYLPCTCKIPGQDHFWALNFYFIEPIFKIFVALFTTFGMQKDDNIRFISWCFRTRLFAKRWFPKDGVRRVIDRRGSKTVRKSVFENHKFAIDSKTVRTDTFDCKLSAIGNSLQ